MASVTAYETWSTEARRGLGAAAASGHDRKFVVALARGLDVLRAAVTMGSIETPVLKTGNNPASGP